MAAALQIGDVAPGEHARLGQLMIDVYAALPGFASPTEQPGYYRMLANIGAMHQPPDTRVLVARSPDRLLGGVVYFSDMANYGSGGTATAQTDAAGIRLLCVAPAARGAGVGRALTDACIALARARGRAQVILHTTRAMQVAWALYLRMGFERSEDLDFLQQALPVFGFRLRLAAPAPIQK